MVYKEPTPGVTHCSNPSASFWAGIGNKSNALGQDGTVSGAGTPGLHEVFYENLPASEAFPGVKAPAGADVVANVRYQGSDTWTYDVNVNGTNHSYGGKKGNYDGSVVEDIVERTSVHNSFTPLLNFKSVNIQGYTGRTGQPLSPTKKWEMTGFATTDAISDGDFTVKHDRCGG